MTYLLAGLTLLFFVLRDVFQSVVVPRGKAFRLQIAPVLVHFIIWPPFRTFASVLPTATWRAEFLGMFGPFVLMLLLTIWMCLLITSFGLICFSLAGEFQPPLDSFHSALFVAGSSVLTLGSSDFACKSISVRILTLIGAFTGVVLTASVVSLMFTLIGAIQRREVLVSLTSNIAGTPPSGLAILETHFSLNGQGTLEAFYNDWHRWCADVYETHQAYQILPYFRSTNPNTSWLTALGAALDSVSLLLAVDHEFDSASARLMFHFGTKLIGELCHHWELTPGVIDTSTESFHTIYERLQQEGYCRQDELPAREKFMQLRARYAPAHKALCDYLLVPITPLITDFKLPPLD